MASTPIFGNVPLVVRERCHYCSQYRDPREMISVGIGGVRMCWGCHEWHVHNINALAHRGPPPGCFECRATWDELRLRLDAGDNAGDVKMFLVPKDGIYQLLCRSCSDAYELKRADLLRGTLYGQRKGV